MFWKVRATLALAGDLEVGQALEQELLAVAAGQRDHAFGRLVEAGDAVEHRRLAGAVRADQRGDLAALGLEGQVADGDQAAELHRQMLDREDRQSVMAETAFISRVPPW